VVSNNYHDTRIDRIVTQSIPGDRGLEISELLVFVDITMVIQTEWWVVSALMTHPALSHDTSSLGGGDFEV